ncbi:MAG: DUF427 domain-containing protein [Pseudomonadota bacterium]
MDTSYRLEVEPVQGPAVARSGNSVVAEGAGAVVMHETRLPPTLYWPAETVRVALTPSPHRSFCPFKGTAEYFHAELPGRRVENAVWHYPKALAEGVAVEGMLAFSGALVDRVEGPLPAARADGHIQGPLVDWLLREAGALPDGVALTEAFAGRMLAHGIAVARLSVMLWSLHPQIAGVNYVWERKTGAVRVNHPRYETIETPAFANSPLRYVSMGMGGVRQPLDVAEPEFDFPILDDLRAEGMTDYVAMPLPFASGMTNVLTLASDHPGGFTTPNLGLVFECSGPIARYYEVQQLRTNAATLLGTYLGPRTGARVLDGEIRRGEGEEIEAAILMADLRGSTRWAAELPRDAYLALLNGFFETVADAVAAEGGEVLKFIGDAVLAVFPAGDAARAARAAAAIPGAVASLEGGPEAAVGVSLGAVTYGNVGARDRLDFTVIGEAAVIAARLSDLGKVLGEPVLMTAAVAGAAGSGRALGSHALHNVSGRVEVFAPEGPAGA